MGWVHPTSWTLYTTIEILQSLNSQKVSPFRLIHICILPLGSGAWRLACVQVYFLVPVVFVETYVYDDVFVKHFMTLYVRTYGHISS